MAITGHISTHFKWWDDIFIKSGWTKIPDVVEFDGVKFSKKQGMDRAKHHAQNMEKLRTRLNNMRRAHGLPTTGILIESWVRSPEHNIEIGGAKLSRHQYWDACDISVQEINRICPWENGEHDFDAACNSVFVSGGFGTYPNGARHVDSRGYRSRWSTFTPGV